MGAYIINVPSTVDRIIYVNVHPMDKKTYLASYSVDEFTPYTAPNLEQIRKEAYEKGRKDGKVEGRAEAWDAARKICLNDSDGGLTVAEIANIFDVSYYRDAMKKYSAAEALEEIRAYEQAQKEKEEQIKIGDEVKCIGDDWTAIVTRNEEGYLTLMDSNGGIANGYDAKRFTKTGRQFPEIASILAKMREESNG